MLFRSGATGAGCLSALVVRPYNAPLGIGAQPDIVDVDLIVHNTSNKLSTRFTVATT